MRDTTAIDSETKYTAIIAYLTVIGLIIACVINCNKKSRYVSFHIVQSVGLALTAIVLIGISAIPILGWIISIQGYVLLLILWISGLLNAIKGAEEPVPVLGRLYQRWITKPDPSSAKRHTQ